MPPAMMPIVAITMTLTDARRLKLSATHPRIGGLQMNPVYPTVDTAATALVASSSGTSIRLKPAGAAAAIVNPINR